MIGLPYRVARFANRSPRPEAGAFFMRQVDRADRTRQPRSWPPLANASPYGIFNSRD
jgi:hypothetical protein